MSAVRPIQTTDLRTRRRRHQERVERDGGSIIRILSIGHRSDVRRDGRRRARRVVDGSRRATRLYIRALHRHRTARHRMASFVADAASMINIISLEDASQRRT